MPLSQRPALGPSQYSPCQKEILQLVGFYWGLGRLCTALDIEIETPDGLTSVNAVANLNNPQTP